MKPQNRIEQIALNTFGPEPPVEVRTPARSRFTVQKYQCEANHVSEIVVEDRERMNTQKCRTPKCRKDAEHVRVKAERNAQPKSTIVYEKLVDGKMKRMYGDPPEPLSIKVAVEEGYQRREIQGLAEMRRFEKEVTREMKEEHARERYSQAKRKEESEKRYRDDMRSLRSQADDFTKGVIDAALNDTGGYSRNAEPEFRNRAWE